MFFRSGNGIFLSGKGLCSQVRMRVAVKARQCRASPEITQVIFVLTFDVYIN